MQSRNRAGKTAERGLDAAATGLEQWLYMLCGETQKPAYDVLQLRGLRAKAIEGVLRAARKVQNHNIRALFEQLREYGGISGYAEETMTGTRTERAPPSPSKMPLIDVRLFEMSSLAW